MTSYFGRVFTHAGVLAVFKPRRGRLKIPVAPTGKLKLHVFPLRRAKENKGFSPLDTHNPLKRIDLNFFDRFPKGYRAISTNPHSKILHFYPSLQILKKPLTNLSSGGIIDKLSRETRVQTSGQTAIEKLENCIDAQSWWKEFVKCGEKFVEKLKASSKNFFKKLQKTSWQKGNGMI